MDILALEILSKWKLYVQQKFPKLLSMSLICETKEVVCSVPDQCSSKEQHSQIMKYFLVYLDISALTIKLCTYQAAFIDLTNYRMYYLPGTILGSENIAVKQINKN